jgi:hypothetical protein
VEGRHNSGDSDSSVFPEYDGSAYHESSDAVSGASLQDDAGEFIFFIFFSQQLLFKMTPVG